MDATVSDEMGLQPDTRMASVYVLRSLSEDPQVKALPELHNIGSTSSTAEDRVASAACDTTFLGAPVGTSRSTGRRAASRPVRDHPAPHIRRGTHGRVVRAHGYVTAETNEWFAVPFRVIEEAVRLIESDAIVNYEDDTEQQRLRLRSSQPSQ